MSYEKKAKRLTKVLQSHDQLLYAKIEYDAVKVLIGGQTYIAQNPKIAIYRHTPEIEYPLTIVPIYVSEIWLLDNFKASDMEVHAEKYQHMNNLTYYIDREKAKARANREEAAGKEYASYLSGRSIFTF